MVATETQSLLQRRLIKAEQNRHQRGFTGAVFAQQGMDLTLAQLQGNVVIGDDTWELFGDIQHFNCIRSFQVERPPSVFMARTRTFTGTETILMVSVYHKARLNAKLFCSFFFFLRGKKKKDGQMMGVRKTVKPKI